MCSDVSTFCKNENEMNQELGKLFKEKKLEEFDCSEISKCLWKMDLTKYQSLFDSIRSMEWLYVKVQACGSN